MLRIQWNWHEGFVGADRFIGLNSGLYAHKHTHVYRFIAKIENKQKKRYMFDRLGRIFNIPPYIILKNKNRKFCVIFPLALFRVDHVCCFSTTYSAFERIFLPHSFSLNAHCLFTKRRFLFSTCSSFFCCCEAAARWEGANAETKRKICFVYLTTKRKFILVEWFASYLFKHE